MIKIFKLNKENINHCINLIFCNKEDFDYFQQIGWSQKEYLNQIDKKINYSFGISKNKKIIGFIIGDLINVEKKSEYEILLIYVDKNFRNQGHASYLIDALNISLKQDKLQRITLEVPSSNYIAINLYKKNFFYEIGKRKNYYSSIENIKEDALIFEKKINE